jgi:uncharacterized protein YbjT (DUF2867 family)
MNKKIAIIGATGMLGKPVARALVNAGFEVTALVRDESAARAQLPSEVQLIKGDLSDINSIEIALQGKDGVYINLNVKQDEKENDFHTESAGLKNIIEVAKKVQLKRIAFISSIVMRYQGMNGFNWWVFRMKHDAVAMIRQSGIPYTIFYASAFMDCFHYVYRQGTKIRLAGKSEHKLWFIAADDYALQVVNSFNILKDESKEYIIQGPEAFTADEAAREFISNYSREKLSISKAPIGLLKLLGRFIRKVNYVSHIVEALNKYPEKFEADNTWRELGTPETTLKAFARNSQP